MQCQCHVSGIRCSGYIWHVGFDGTLSGHWEMTPSIAAIPPFSFGVHYCLFTRTMVRRAGEVPLPLTAHARDRMTKPGRTSDGGGRCSPSPLAPRLGASCFAKGEKTRSTSLSLTLTLLLSNGQRRQASTENDFKTTCPAKHLTPSKL